MLATAVQNCSKTISRQRKDLIISETSQLLKKRILIFTQCNNLSSKDFDQLRLTLSKSKISTKYLKTSLFKLALKDYPQYSQLNEAINGPIVALSSDQEPGEAGKALLTVIKENPNIFFLAGKIEEKIWTNEGCVDVLQNLEKKTDLQAKILGLLQAPPSALTSALSQNSNILAHLVQLCGNISNNSDAKITE